MIRFQYMKSKMVKKFLLRLIPLFTFIFSFSALGKLHNAQQKTKVRTTEFKTEMILFYKEHDKIVIKQCEDVTFSDSRSTKNTCKIKPRTKIKRVPLHDLKNSLKMTLQFPKGDYNSSLAKKKVELYENIDEKNTITEILSRKKNLRTHVARVKFFIKEFANEITDLKILSDLRNSLFQFERELNTHAQLDQVIKEIEKDLNAFLHNIVSGGNPKHISSKGNTGFIFNVLEAYIKPQILSASFQKIQAGKFLMGSSPEESQKYNANAGQKQVTISKPFDIMTTEMTQKQWFSCMGNNPSYFKRPEDCKNHLTIRGEGLCPDNPIESATWKEIQQCIKRLNNTLGLSDCKGTPKDPKGCYRLPTEAEWEFAARGKTTTAYFFGNNSAHLGNYAWYWSNSGDKTHPVGLKKPNLYGLYDIHGNVWEWVQDSANEFLIGGSDPLYASSNSDSQNYYTVRGGCWYGRAWVARSEKRHICPSSATDNRVGFRLVKTN